MHATYREQRVRSRQFSVRALLIVVTICCILVGAARLYYGRTEIAGERMLLNRIAIAMRDYEQKFGVLPFDPRGADYALYSVASTLEPLGLKLDHKERKVTDDSILYLNEKESQCDEHRIILIAHSQFGGFLGTCVCAVGRSDCWSTGADSLLGTWRSQDGFFFRTKSLFDEWSSTHPSNGAAWSIALDERSGFVRAASVGGRSITYQYKNGRLAGCRVVFADAVVVENVTADDCGRVERISRSTRKRRPAEEATKRKATKTRS